MPRLVAPSVAFVPSLREAARRHGDDPQAVYSREAAALRDDEMAAHAQRFDDHETVPQPGRVPATDRWWVEGEEFLARIQIRHHLDPSLRGYGGHVGYHVVRDHRGRGHGTAMLAAALPVCAELGLECVLLTCDVENIASQRVIEANGGLFWDLAGRLRRYWLPTFR